MNYIRGNFEIKKIYTYFKALKIESITSLAILRYYGFKFLEENNLNDLKKRNFFISKICDFDFLDPKVYLVEHNDDFRRNLSNFRDELLIAIDKQFNPSDENILKRQVSPPLSAYEWIGTNMLHIKTSTSDYGFLWI